MAMDLPPIPFDVPQRNSFEGLPGLDMGGAMPSPPPAAPGGQAPAQGGKGDRRQWLKLAAIIPAALKGGPGAMEGLLAGFQQAEAQRQQQAQVASADQRAQAQEQRLNQQASWQQQYQQAQLDAQAEQRRSELVKEFAAALTTDTVTDDEGVRALTQLYEARGRALGMRPGTFETTAMQVVKPSRLERQAATRKLDQLRTQFGAANWQQEGGKFLHELPGGRRVTLPQLLEIAGMPADPQAPQQAAQSTIALDAPLDRQHAAALASGNEELATLIERAMTRQDATRRDPPSGGEALVSVTETDPATGEQVTSLVPRRPGEVSRRPAAPPNQAQFTAAGYAGRMEQAEGTIAQLEPNIADMNWALFEAQVKLPSAGQSASMQSYMQAARNFINAVLRRESGAVISPSEFAEARQQYLPQPGDTPETLAQKRANRQYVFDTMKRAGGRAYEPPITPQGRGAGPAGAGALVNPFRR